MKSGITGQDKIKFHPSKKIKICFVIGTLQIGGAEKQLYLLIKNLDKKIFETVLISLRSGRMKEDFKKITKLYILEKKYKFDLFILFRLIKILKREKPNILHTFMFTSNFWGRIAGIICKIPVIIASERSLDLWKKWYHLFIDKILLKFTKKIVCNSEEVKNIYLKRLNASIEKVDVIYNGIEIEKYEKDEIEFDDLKKEFGIENEKIVLTGGRLSFEKNLETFLYVSKRVKEEFEEVKFLIVGEGPERGKLERLIQNLGLEKDIIFTGFRQDLPKLIKISDIIVLISLWEGMPNLILEGMACKKPVICSEYGGGKEIIDDGINGFLVKPKDIEDISKKILFLLQNPEICKSMGEKNYLLVKKNFSVEKMIENYQNFYFKILNL
ncbi:MAG: glycosyltransferase [Candidatus Omnitrophica bacterium]|nr:glycosyltransferase [Candidatus Omnitrophota bacterium]